MGPRSLKVLASVWQPCSGSSAGTEERSGPRGRQARAPRSISLSAKETKKGMRPLSRNILLVEDNPDDEELTRVALRENKILNDLVVARDGPEALDYLFGEDNILPQVVLLDLKLPKI